MTQLGTRNPRLVTRFSGFTLLEVMVASIIAGFVALTAVAALHGVTRTRARIDELGTAAGELHYAAGLIRADLENLYRARQITDTRLEGSDDSDRGGQSRLICWTVSTAKARPDQPEGDLYEAEYRLVRRENGTALIRRLWPNPDRARQAGGVVTVIAEGIEIFEVRFFDGKEWQPEWTAEQKTLPEQVAVVLALPVRDGKEKLQESFFVNFTRWPK